MSNPILTQCYVSNKYLVQNVHILLDFQTKHSKKSFNVKFAGSWIKIWGSNRIRR